MSEILVLQHAEIETPGIAAEIFKARGIKLRTVRCYAGEPVPSELGAAAALLIMGGPMGVYEAGRYPHLRDEMRLIENALSAERPVLGICLGSQLLAAVLGSRVQKGPAKEIGWKPVYLQPDAAADALWKGSAPSLTALHWHGDIFDLPAGCVHLASSEMTRYQAFRYRSNAYGFLFHLEMTEPMIRGMAQVFAGEMAEGGMSAETLMKDTAAYLPAAQNAARRIFGAWSGLFSRPGAVNFAG